MPARILIIEDDPTIFQAIRLYLEELTYEVHHVADGMTGRERALAEGYDLVIVDLVLPRLSGIDICSALRAAKPLLPILVLTSKTDEIDIVLALERGADDYLTKPFGVRELAARVRALLRRAAAAAATKREQDVHEEVLVIGDLRIDVTRRVVTVSNTPIELTLTEFELLTYLARRPGRPITREELVRNVWGYTAEHYELLNSSVYKLRRKIDVGLDGESYIATLRGIGYKFRDDRED